MQRGPLRRKRATQAQRGTAHHFVQYSCLCSEAGNILNVEDTGTWRNNAAAALSFKRKSFRKCAELVNGEAAVISGWDETLELYSPYIYQGVHLAFPLRKFKTRQMAKSFLAHAFTLDESDDVLRPYLRECVERVFHISKNPKTRKTTVSVEEGDGEEAFTALIDFYSA